MSHHLHAHDNVMTGASQTMAAWSRLLESRDEISTVYLKQFDEQFDSAQPFPRVIWTPSLERFPRKTTEKLICDTDDALYVFEKNGSHIDVKCYPYSDIHGSELGIVLLDSWITVYGRTSQGEAASSKIHVNTTSLRYFASIQKKLRPSISVTDGEQFKLEKDRFNSLATVHFKFMNYGRESLIPGETVLQFVLQQEIREPLFTLFGKTFHKDLSPAHLTILTDHELILLQDVERVKESKISTYGGVWQYVPLHCIDSVTIAEAPNDRLTLLIHCQPGRTIDKLFDASSRSELKQFLSRFESLL